MTKRKSTRELLALAVGVCRALADGRDPDRAASPVDLRMWVEEATAVLLAREGPDDDLSASLRSIVAVYNGITGGGESPSDEHFYRWLADAERALAETEEVGDATIH